MKRKNILLAGLLAVFALSSLAACGDKEQKVTEEHLKDRAFVMQSVDGREMPAMMNMPEVSFDGEMMMSANICNRLRGKAEIVDGKVVVKDMVSTKMACPAEVMEMENAFMRTMRDGWHVIVDGERTTMAPPAGADAPNMTFVLKPGEAK